MKFLFIERNLSGRRTALIALAILLATSSLALRAPATAKVGKMPKDRAARHQIRTSDGAQLSLAELRGQVVVLDFFATWCGHSKRHVPVISQLDTQRRADGLRVIGLAVEEQASTAAQFARDQQISYPVGTISDPIFANYVESRDVSVPQTLVYGRDGRLVAHFIGHSPEIETALAEAVRRELEKR